MNKDEGNSKTQAKRPITEPYEPVMQIQSRRLSPHMYPPGTAFNPIGIPPWAQQPTVPSQPQMPMQPRPTLPTSPIGFPRQEGPPVMTDPNYLQGYLIENIGRFVRIDFLIGTTTLIDKSGTLIDVGIDYVVLREAETDDLDICDLYSIKFVKIFF